MLNMYDDRSYEWDWWWISRKGNRASSSSFLQCIFYQSSSHSPSNDVPIEVTLQSIIHYSIFNDSKWERWKCAEEREKSDTNLVWFGSRNVVLNGKDEEEFQKGTSGIGRCHLLPSKGNPTESFCRQFTNRRKAKRNSPFDIERCQFTSIYCVQIAGTEIWEKYFTSSLTPGIDWFGETMVHRESERDRDRPIEVSSLEIDIQQSNCYSSIVFSFSLRDKCTKWYK